MSDKTSRYTILGAGEHYHVELEPRKTRMVTERPDPTIVAGARARLSPRLEQVLHAAERLPANSRLSETVVEIRMGEKYSAKSHHPAELLDKAGLTLRGTGTWTAEAAPARATPRRRGEQDTKPEPVRSRALFVSGTIAAITKLAHTISTSNSAKTECELVKLEDIRLPAKADRIRLDVDATAARVAVEIVLFDWKDRLLSEALKRVYGIFRKAGVADNDIRVKSYENGPTFVGAVIPSNITSELGDLNFLRSARALPRVALTEAVLRRALGAKPPSPVSNITDLPEIAVFDGGFAAGNPLLDPYVTSTSLTNKPPRPTGIEHGTMVSSAVVYGPFDGTGAIPAPTCRVRNFRVLPDPKNDALELYGVIDALEAQVPKLGSEISVINLSLGPPGPIDDSAPTRFTYAIDRLTREHQKLFVIASGNWGDKPGQERVQPPGDSVNNITVGAYRHDSNGSPEYARYSSRGRGRPGNVMKPDVVAFGGCAARPFFGLIAPNMLAGVTGTSFAAPVVASLAGRLIGSVNAPTPLSPEALRVLLINSARKVAGATTLEVGHGAVPVNIEAILECSPTRVSVLYQGVLSPRQGWKLPFLLPPDFQANGNVRFSWTIALSPDVMQSTPDEYTLAGVELGFRPHADVYSYAPPHGITDAPRTVNIIVDADTAEELELAGWNRSYLPVADSKPAGKDERALRAIDGKWETVVSDERGKRAESISEPMLSIQVLGRGDWNRRDPSLQARYAALLTVDAPKYGGDLYAQVMSVFPKVGPLAVRDRTRVARIR